MNPAEPISRTYRLAMGVCAVAVRRWGRLEVSGVEHLPRCGPVLLAGNHDSYWDPLAIGIAELPRRQIRALAKSSIWRVPGLGRILDGIGQIPIERGASDARALDRAVSELAGGARIGVFPEGTRSLGRTLRARSGPWSPSPGGPAGPGDLRHRAGHRRHRPLPQAPADKGALLSSCGGIPSTD